jgi:phenylacetate-coenzyme A ligase PaaK-like adenylate-forming protein
MEEILPTLRKKIQEKIHIAEDKNNSSFVIIISETPLGKLAYPGEIEKMLIMFGGLNSKIPLQVSINEKEQKISVKVENQSDYSLVHSAVSKIWDNAIFMFSEILRGNFDVIKDLPEIDE